MSYLFIFSNWNTGNNFFRKETEDYVRFPLDNNVHQGNKNTVSYNLYNQIYYLYTQ